MNVKHLCIGMFSLLATIQVNAIDNTSESVINQSSKFKSALNKVASLVVMDQKDPDGRARRHGAGGALFGILLGQALVWGPCHLTAVAASTFGTPLAGAGVETAIHVGSPFIAVVATKVSLALGTFFGIITGPI